jgi:hypothetical protein
MREPCATRACAGACGGNGATHTPVERGHRAMVRAFCLPTAVGQVGPKRRPPRAAIGWWACSVKKLTFFRSIADWLAQWWVATGSILDRPDGAVRAQRKCSGTTAHLKPGARAQHSTATWWTSRTVRESYYSMLLLSRPRTNEFGTPLPTLRSSLPAVVDRLL